MRVPFLQRIRSLALWLALDLLVAAALLAFSVMADSSAKLRTAPKTVCYCGCALSKTSAGCGKMCDLPKYATRRWAVTCAKPHEQSPTETPNAGPRLSHPAHSERASN